MADAATVTLNRKLNLVIPVDTPKGTAYVHSAPISRLVFQENFLAISRAFTAIYTNGLGPVAGPRVAKLLLLKEADAIGERAKVESQLLQEIYRLTNVFAPSDKGGWETLPYNVARQRGLIDEDTAEEVENPIIYFICASAIHMKAELSVAMEGLSQLWRAQTTLLASTDYMRSLPTSTPAETTGEKPTSKAAAPAAASQSSIPV